MKLQGLIHKINATTYSAGFNDVNKHGTTLVDDFEYDNGACPELVSGAT